MHLCVIANTVTVGQRSTTATRNSISRGFYSKTLSEYVYLLVSSWIHCSAIKRGANVPSTYRAALFGTKPKKLGKLDYIYLCPIRTDEKYVLMARNDHSSCIWFYLASSTDSEMAANALLDWSAAFGAPQGLISDVPTHFKNETFCLLAEGLRSSHHFTLLNCPRSNVAVVHLSKEFLRVASAILSELQVHHEYWRQLVPLFQSPLKNAPSIQRESTSPIT